MIKSHFTLLLLQLEQPARDLVWPFRGMGRLLVVAVEDVSVSGSNPGEVDVVVSAGCIEKQERSVVYKQLEFKIRISSLYQIVRCVQYKG